MSKRWPSEESQESKQEDRAPLDRLGVILFHNLFLPLTPSWYVIRYCGNQADPSPRNRALASVYVVFVTAGLVAMWLISPTGGIAKTAFGVLAFIRWLEIFTVGLGIVLKQKESVLGTSLVTIAFLGVHVVLCFAILDHSFATAGFVLHSELANSATMPTSAAAPSLRRFDYLYISWTQMTTLGNPYEPTTDVARGLTMATATSGILLLGVFVSSALAHRAVGFTTCRFPPSGGDAD